MTNRDWNNEINKRVEWLKLQLRESGAVGFAVGASGGKDSAVVLSLCKLATPNVIGIIMPCGNIDKDRDHALILADNLGIRTIEVNLQETFVTLSETVETAFEDKLHSMGKTNIKPRLRMATLYSVAQTLGYLVAGTGNRSEATMGYFTKWGDGAYDINPIADLTVTELFVMGKVLGVPDCIIDKAPSAGLWEGQTDETEMGISYAAIDKYLLEGTGTERDIEKIVTTYKKTEHKRGLPKCYTSAS